eukprot:TRINITY_DN9100_c0_g1_i2.p1 TRINITY_DN9100_c0_g1~~TRINITY_DN9100_c0_g1_i2.p1  ORF type:complete len:619 (-),score=149.59 TRINITY_DN9100_c0_g1_i2:61-1917(-)
MDQNEEIQQNSCFFDEALEADKSRDFKLWTKATRGYTPPPNDLLLISGDFQKRRRNLSFLWTASNYCLYESATLVCVKKGKVKQYANVRFAKLKEVVQTKDTDGSDMAHPYGLILVRNGDKIELFTQDKEQWVEWRRALARFSVMTTFHENYAVHKMIGKGNFARVYLAENKSTRKQFAVKAFEKARLLFNLRGKDSLMNEISVMQALDHPNIIKLYEVYESKSSIYLIMELVLGGEMSINIVNERDAGLILKKLLVTLVYLHEKRIMHRDIKPENILLKNSDDPMEMKLADFGLATRLDVDEFLFTKCGTPGYVAPEVFQHKKYDVVCDIFSVGIMFYRMLTGLSPFYAKDHKVILEKNKIGVIDFGLPVFKFISKEAFELLQRLLEKDPTKRLTAQQALRHDFFLDLESNFEVSPDTAPRVNLLLLRAQSEENRFDMGRLKKNTLDEKGESPTKLENRVATPKGSGSTFVGQENIYNGRADNELVDSREHSFNESLQMLQSIGRQKESSIFKPMGDTEKRVPVQKAVPLKKGDDLRRQALLNMHRISVSDHKIPNPLENPSHMFQKSKYANNDAKSDQEKLDAQLPSDDDDSMKRGMKGGDAIKPKIHKYLSLIHI